MYFFLNHIGLTVIIGILGLEFGSFANVCIYRWPREGSVISPRRSQCPWCKRTLLWFDNIPVLSFLFLKGRCRSCSSPISWRYPFVELSIPILWLMVTPFLFSDSRNTPILFLFAIFFFLFTLVVTFMTDIDWKIIPDESTLSLFFVGLFTSPWNPFLGEGATLQRGLNSLLGALAGAGVLWIISEAGRRLMSRDVMGWGDIKLLGAMGTVLGAEGVTVTLFLGSFLGGIVAIIGLVFGKIKRHQYIPFGPFLNVAGLLVLLTKLKFPILIRSLWRQ